MILLYSLQRPDIFPADDFHLKEIMVKRYGLDPKTKLRANMLARASVWAGQRSLGTLYLLGWKAHSREKPMVDYLLYQAATKDSKATQEDVSDET
jgi:DNA-3-methyladenine glycosylase II